MEWFNAIVQGILLGGLYALFAAGLSLMFGVMRFVNLAHGDFIVMAAFGALVLVEVLGLHPLLTLVVVLPLMTGIGYFGQRLVLNRVVGRDILPSILVTFGFSVILQNLMLEPKISSWSKTGLWQVVDVEPMPVFGKFYNG